MQNTLKEAGIEEFTVAELSMVPQTELDLSDSDLEVFEKLVDAIEDLEDVQTVHHNVNA